MLVRACTLLYILQGKEVQMESEALKPYNLNCHRFLIAVLWRGGGGGGGDLNCCHFFLNSLFVL